MLQLGGCLFLFTVGLCALPSDVCEQTKITNIFAIGSDVYLQVAKQYWHWKDTFKIPKLSNRMLQLVLFDIGRPANLNPLIQQGFNGYLNKTHAMWTVHTDSDKAFVMGRKKRDQFIIFGKNSKVSTPEDESMYKIFETITMGSNGIKGSNKPVYYYSEETGNLLVGFVGKKNENTVRKFYQNMTHTDLPSYYHKWGRPVGFWKLNGTVYWHSEYNAGTYSESDDKFENFFDKATEKEISGKVLDMFGCGVNRKLKDVSIDELNSVLVFLVYVFSIINFILLFSLVFLCLYKRNNIPAKQVKKTAKKHVKQVKHKKKS